MAFWIVTGILGLAVAGLMLLALLRRGERAAPDQASDVRVYRDQLAEVERDLARGVLSGEDAERVRVEVSRRLLEADRAAQGARGAGAAPKALTITGAVVVLAALAGSFALYRTIGQPGYPDLPLSVRIAAADEARASRPPQAEIEAEVAARRQPPPDIDTRTAELITLLRKVVTERPDDLEGLRFLVGTEAQLGNYKAAYEAQSQLIAVKGSDASIPDYSRLAELMIESAGGYVSPEAEAVLARVLEMDPSNGVARFYLGLSYWQTDRPDLTFRIWSQLFRDSPATAPWLPYLREMMPEVAAYAGVRWSPPELRGPSAEDMANAADMTPEDRMQMIRGMVDGLAARLGAEGGPPEDWARLISSLGVLGETGEASAIWTEAQAVFADAPEALATIRAAAERAGVAE